MFRIDFTKIILTHLIPNMHVSYNIRENQTLRKIAVGTSFVLQNIQLN